MSDLMNLTPLQLEMVGQIRRFVVETILFNQKVADRTGLHLTDMQCMNLLDLLGTTTPGKLAEGLGLTTGGVTVMLDRLEKSGCIKRESNPDDRRSVLIRVSAKKMEKLHSQYYSRLKAQFAQVLSDTPDEELEVVLKFFTKINEIHPAKSVV
jgi:DNA-binding MarR family transcriptional regulator